LEDEKDASYMRENVCFFGVVYLWIEELRLWMVMIIGTDLEKGVVDKYKQTGRSGMAFCSVSLHICLVSRLHSTNTHIGSFFGVVCLWLEELRLCMVMKIGTEFEKGVVDKYKQTGRSGMAFCSVSLYIFITPRLTFQNQVSTKMPHCMILTKPFPLQLAMVEKSVIFKGEVS